jgi:hypothetical protein
VLLVKILAYSYTACANKAIVAILTIPYIATTIYLLSISRLATE